MERRIEIVIAAQDDYSAALNKFNAAMGNVEGRAGQMSGAIAGIRSAWMQLGAVVASSAWLVAAAKKSYEAEIAFNKLRIQVDALGVSYAGQVAAIDSAIAATSRYAIVQDEDVAAVLQQLVFHTGNLKQSMQNLNLVYDLAYMKGIDVATSSTIVGKAIAGNIEGLGRVFLELKDVNELLGEHATRAEKAAFAQQFLKEKTSDAKEKMNEHEKAVKRVNAAYEKVHQFIGSVVIKHLDSIVQGVGAVRDVYNELTGVLDTIAGKINPYAVAIKKNTDGLMDYEKAIRLVGSAHDKTADQIAAAAKKKSAAVEAQIEKDKAQLERMKKMIVPEGGGSLSAFILGDLSSPALGQKVELAGLQLGRKLLEGFTEATAERPDPFAIGELDFSMAYVRRTEDYAAYIADYLRMTEEKYLREEEIEQMMFDRRPAASTSFQEILIGTYRGYFDRLVLMTEEYSEKEMVEAFKRRDVQAYAAQQTAAMVANSMQNLYIATGSKNKAMFTAMKAFSVASTIIKTYEDAVGGAAALSKIPYIGPALAIAYKASAIASGLAMVAQIRATEPGSASGSISASGTANPDYSGGSTDAYPVPTSTEEKSVQNITLNIYNPLADENWQKIVEDNIIPAINDAASRDINIEVNTY